MNQPTPDPDLGIIAEDEGIDDIQTDIEPVGARDYSGHQPQFFDDVLTALNTPPSDEFNAKFEAAMADTETTYDFLAYINHPLVKIEGFADESQYQELVEMAETVDHFARHYDVVCYEYIVNEDGVVIHKPRVETFNFWTALIQKVISEQILQMMGAMFGSR